MSKALYFTMVILGLVAMAALASIALWFYQGEKMVEAHQLRIAKEANETALQIENLAAEDASQRLLAGYFSRPLPARSAFASLWQPLADQCQVTGLKVLSFPQVVYAENSKVIRPETDRLLTRLEEESLKATRQFNDEQKKSYIEIDEELFSMRIFTTVFAQGRNQLQVLCQRSMPLQNIEHQVIEYITWRVVPLVIFLLLVSIMVYYFILARIE